MSKKVVVVPNHKWCVVEAMVGASVAETHRFGFWKNRSMARQDMKSCGGTVRKVSKIVYHYE